MSRPLSLVVFDLDFTLWDCGGLWVDCADFPFRGNALEGVVDSSGRHLRLYEDVPRILDFLDAEGIPMALASRTGQPDWAIDLLKRLGIEDRFVESEIFPASKVNHFQNLAASTGIDFGEMVFFDDEGRNIVEVGALGVTSIEVRSGMSFRLLEEGLAEHRLRH